jgi:Na+-translocating ferredoxin:NAD+ oxidoreductase RnfA subunit
MIELVLMFTAIVLSSLFVLVYSAGLSVLNALLLSTSACVLTGLVLIALDGLHHQHQHADIANIWRGLPILLISASILFMALLGLSGYVLA